MTQDTITGIDASSWQVTLLPFPKRFSRSKALGFCGGYAVGVAETARAKLAACWWPQNAAELLTLEGRENVQAAHAHGTCIPGSWWPKKNADYRAVRWEVRDGRLVSTELHDTRFERTWATGTGAGLVVGNGTFPGKLGQRPPDAGLVWRDAALVKEVRAAEDVSLRVTDGVRLAGCIGQHAALWPAMDAEPINLATQGMFSSEACALDGDAQYGTAWKGMRSRAAQWRGSGASFTDLTPGGFEVGSVLDASSGLQVGFVREKDVTQNGSANLATRAALWQGSGERWFDLNTVLPARGDFNASIAWAIELDNGTVRIAGAVSQYGVSDPGTARESHYLPTEQAAIWTARLR